MFYSRRQQACVAVVSRPDSDPRSAIEVELTPDWDTQGLIGFQVFAAGEASFATSIPQELSCLNLGADLSVTVLGRDYIFDPHSTQSKWKDARKMVAADRLSFLQPATSGGKSSTPGPRVPKDDTLAALQKNPLAVRLELVKREEVIHLALTAVPGVSALLNNGSHSHDPDDVTFISTLPVVTVDKAMVLIYQSGATPTDVARDEALQELFDAYIPEHVALYASPGRAQRAKTAREDFQLLVAKHEILRHQQTLTGIPTTILNPFPMANEFHGFIRQYLKCLFSFLLISKWVLLTPTGKSNKCYKFFTMKTPHLEYQ